MDNLPDTKPDTKPDAKPEIKSVIFQGQSVPKALSFDEYHQTVSMSTLKLDDLTLSDFKRIHTFFRKVAARKFGDVQQ